MMEKENKFTPRPADLNAFAAGIRRRNAEKGFWPESGRNLSEAFMLIVEEIGEAITAHRKNRFCSLSREDLDYAISEWLVNPVIAQAIVEDEIKGTVDEELADISIRCFDLNGECVPQSQIYHNPSWMFTSESHVFCEKMAPVTKKIATLAEQSVGERILPGRKPSEPFTLSACIYAIEHIAHSMNIDLWAIVQLKLAYNATRPFMHGKNY